MNHFASLARVVLPLVALVITSVAWCSEPLNPKPCPDPWVCKYPPALVDVKPQGDTIVCWGTTGGWNVAWTLVPGKKTRCDQEADVNGTVTWTWALSGPESSSGVGDSFSYTPKTCGDYTITWTASVDSDEPCEDYSEQAYYNFNVPTPPLETTIESVEVCPGKSVKSHWTITNTSDQCGYEYWYLVVHGEGEDDPTVNVDGGEDTVYVGPGATEEGDLTIKVPQSTKRGVKNLNWYVFTKCEVSGDRKWTVTVPPVDIGGDDPEIEICPLEQGKKLKWKITNKGACMEVVTLDGAYDPKLTLTSVGALNKQGGEIAPGQSLEVEADVTCQANSPGGTGEYTLKVSVDPLGVVATLIGKVKVLPPTGTIVFKPFLYANGQQAAPSAEPGESLRLPYTITNTGKCTETLSWTITSNNPDVGIAGVANGAQQFNPGQALDFEAIVNVSPDAQRGHAIILGVLNARGAEIHRDTTHLEIVVCDQLNPPTYTVTVADEPAICIGSSKPDVFTFTNTSNCPATITWEVTKKSGKPDVTVSSNSGSYSVFLPKFQSVDVPVTIAVPLESLAGEAVMNIKSVDQYGNEKNTTFGVSAYKLIMTSHNKEIFNKWSSGQKVRIKLKVEGRHKDDTFKYELVNIEKEGSVQWSTESNALSVDAPITEPGRYLVRASDLVRTVPGSPVFTCFKITFAPKGRVEFKWDDNKSLEEQWREPESWSNEAVTTANLSLNATNLIASYGSLVDKNVTDAKRALEDSVQNLELAEIDLQQAAIEAGLERNAAQSIADAAAANVTDLQRTLDNINEQIRQIERANSQPYSKDVRLQLKNLRGMAGAIKQTQLPAAKDALRAAKAALAPLIEKVATIQGAITYTSQRLSILREGIARFATLLAGTGEMVEKFQSLKQHVNAMSKLAGEVSIRFNRLLDLLPTFKIPSLPIIGSAIDMLQVRSLFQETEKLRAGLSKLEEIADKHKAAMDKLTVTRKKAPLVNRLTIETIPGRLPLSFREEDIVWKTKESHIGGSIAEKAWDWRHLVLINGDESGYGMQYYSSNGVSGELDLDYHAYGNLGTSTLHVDVSERKSQAVKLISSTGLTEEEMLAAAEVKFAAETDKMERVKHNVTVMSTALSAGLGFGALMLLAVGSTLAAPIGIAAALVGIIGSLIGLLIEWNTVSSFARSIIHNYPKANT